MNRSRLSALVTLPVAALVLSSCADSDTGSGPAADAAAEGEAMDVVVGFYPLEFLTARVAGDLATVETLTSPGVDPHDVELSPQSVAGVQQADLVIYSSGLQAAVDAAVQEQAADHAFDVNEAADLIETSTEDDHDHDHTDEEHAEDEHAEEDHAEEDGHDHGSLDPHFWLDPERMAGVADAVAGRLAEADPDNADTYRANAEELDTELTALKEEYTAGLADCTQEDLVVSHSAFGYLAEEYGFHQVGITGVTPEAEPSPARLAEVSAVVEEVGATTIYSEVILGADIADTVARETGAQVMVLDPLEGITDASAGSDYLEVMRANLEVLREGQGCS